MTANFEEKKREKRNRDKENLILLRVDRRIEKKKERKRRVAGEREVLSSWRCSFRHLCSLKVSATRPAMKMCAIFPFFSAFLMDF